MPEPVKMSEAYRAIPLDESRRHFVFGDIHGRFATFQRLLGLIKYDMATDVIYSVGDMIDRGPDSVSVIEFFQQPHCHAILGNHEQMVVNHEYWEAVWMDPRNGGPATIRSLKKQGCSLEWLASICCELPICLDVGDEFQDSSFRLIHAECPLDWNESRLMNYLCNTPKGEVAEGRLLWGRDDIEDVESWLEFGSRYKVFVADTRSPRTVFCGHTPVDEVVSAFNVNWIDTFASDRMTCMDPISMEVYQVYVE